MGRIWMVFGAVAGLSAVAMAAYAAHGVADAVAREQVDRAVQMQGWHALALVATGIWAPRGGMLARLAGVAFTLGLIGFCGGVYALALGGLRLPSVAPAGGTLLMLGWALLGASAVRAP